MSTNEPKPRSKADEALQREILRDREFSLSEAIGRLAGPGTMKGASPVSRKQQAEAEIEAFLRQHLISADCLERVLVRVISTSPLLLSNYDQPLIVLAALIQRVLGSDYLIKELVRQADVEWGTTYDERPHFETEGQPPHPDDPYTFESVRTALRQLITVLEKGQPTR
jgi:hypothetical protein